MITDIDNFKCRTESDINNLVTLITHKVMMFRLDPSFPFFLAKFMESACSNLSAGDAKKMVREIDRVAAARNKSFVEAKAGRESERAPVKIEKSKKPMLVGGRGYRDDVFDDDDDDFIPKQKKTVPLIVQPLPENAMTLSSFRSSQKKKIVLPARKK